MKTSQISQIDTSTMSAEDLTTAIMDILKPVKTTSTAFSVYA